MLRDREAAREAGDDQRAEQIERDYRATRPG
jgi:hypothetical protein